MKKHLYILWFILLSLSISNCQGASTTQLEATNRALSKQVNTLMSQLTQQAGSPAKLTEVPSSMSTKSAAPTFSSVTPASLPTQEVAVIAPTLMFSGSGELTPLTISKAYPSSLFGVANVHMICDPNDTTDGKVWIDTQTETVSCKPNSESWALWKQSIAMGDHYIYSENANDKYEFWTVGTTPFKISNRFTYSDFIFILNRHGIYQLSADVLSGVFNLYITCEGAQNFSYKNIAESMTAEVVLNPAGCELLIRNQPPGTLTPGEIEVSLEFVK